MAWPNCCRLRWRSIALALPLWPGLGAQSIVTQPELRDLTDIDSLRSAFNDNQRTVGRTYLMQLSAASAASVLEP